MATVKGAPAARTHLRAAIRLHTGHMNGSVKNDQATEGVEMRHLQAADRALNPGARLGRYLHPKKGR